MIKILLIFILVFESFQKSDVYYTRDISPSSIVKMFKKLNIKLGGNIGLKVHTGEIGGKYFLRPDFLQEIYDYLNGTFIECNTAYPGYDRHYTEGHKRVLQVNGWTDKSRRIIIMDEDPDQDFNLTVANYTNISNNIVGAHIRDFNSCLVLAHFKGHAMGGFGGALKQLSIGFASRAGKSNIHSGGYTTNYTEVWTHKAEQKDFTSAMADAASTIVKFFKERQGIAFINVMTNISVRCDCGVGAPPPKVRDIGILASLDPVAIDRASFDLISKENTDGSREWLNNSKNLLGENTIKVAEQLGIGTQDYNLISVDENNLFWYIFFPVSFVLLVAIGLLILFIYKKKYDSKMANGSLGVSLTSTKKEEE